MRIAYVGRWSDEPGDGVRAKVESHAREWRRRGHDVRLYGLPLVGYGRSEDERPAAMPAAAIARSVRRTARLRDAVARDAPDVAYVRYGLYLPWLRPLQRRVPTVVELNANDRAEAAAMGHRGRALLNEVSRRSLLGGAAGIVCVAHEIERGVAAAGVPTTVIANGIDLDAFAAPVHEPAPRPTAAFLAGAAMPWHGIDKLLDLAAALPGLDVDLVGADAGTLPAAPPPNVRVHPPMPRKDYARILARADIGIGSLAMHRAGLDEASPLKVREYLAHGLPVVLAFDDTDFHGLDPWFLLRLPNTEDNVREGAARVLAFAEAVRGRRIARDEIVDRIDRRAKEDQRLAFMAQVARR